MKNWLSRLVFGAPKDVKDPHAFHKLSLVALLAWVGLGADGLSSSAYGPDEAFRALGEHRGLALFLALATAVTVFVISYGYGRIIEQFPSGGGGYVVASKLLHPRIGVVSGAALLVDYVLTITISMASGADAILSFLPPSAHGFKLPIVFAGLVLLTVLNIRGAKESVTALVPVFVLFLVTHALLLCVAIFGNVGHAAETTHEISLSLAKTTTTLGAFGALKLFVHAYSMGGGTYTGIEAVSNGVGMMREPRVPTAKRTMVLMAVSLAITAGGILLAYLLVGARPEEGKTMNAVLFEKTLGGFSPGGVRVGAGIVIAALVSEGTLLFVAAQAGFLDGPRVMANMASDSWLPHRFAALSNRLSMKNGVLLMSASATLALLYTRGDVSKLVVMYSINVFLTFSLSNAGMLRFWLKKRSEGAPWRTPFFGHGVAFLLCATILVVTIVEKLTEGAWITLLVTSALVSVCFLVKRHYERVGRAIAKLDADLPSPPEVDEETDGPRSTIELFADGPTKGLYEHRDEAAPDRAKPTAILLVGGYGGLGRHALLTLLRMFPEHFGGVVFVSVAVVDSESFKGKDEVASLEKRTRDGLLSYERYAKTLGLPAASAFSVGTEVAVEIEKVAADLITRFPKALFVAGQLVFEEESFENRILHNETALIVQQNLQRRGIPMIVVPVRLDLAKGCAVATPKLLAEV